jgi:excisionase family DNA binding protein
LRVAKSKSGDFYSFEEVLRQLNIDENRLKRLVSEGEIRAFREGEQMRFKRSEIDSLAGRAGRGSSTSDTSLTEISLEEESQPTVHVGGGAGDTLSDELLAEPETGGMRTAELSSQDTFIDQGDIGMSTEPIDFTEEEGGEEPEEIQDIGVGGAASVRRGGAAASTRRRVVVEEARTHPMLIVALALSFIVSICAALTAISVSRGHPNSITAKFAEWFGPEKGTVK